MRRSTRLLALSLVRLVVFGAHAFARSEAVQLRYT